MDKNYGGLIWTNHALRRLKERGIKQGDAWVTWKRPDQSRYAKSRGAWVYYRTFPTSPRLRGTGGGQKIEVIAKENEKKEWIVLSVWSRHVRRSQQSKKEKRSFLQTLKKFFWRT